MDIRKTGKYFVGSMNNQQNSSTSVEGKAAEPRERLRGICKRITDTLGALLFLLPLAFIFDLVGYIPPYLRLFAVYTLLALPLLRSPRASVIRGALALAVVILLNAFAPLPQTAEILLLTAVHVWIWSLSGQMSGWMAQGIGFYTLLHLFLFQSPLGFNLLEGINHAVGWFGQWVTGRTIRTGYTYQNIGSFLLFLCLSIHAWNRGALSKVRTALFLIISLLLNGLLSAVLLTVVGLGPDLTWDLNFRDLFSYKELAAYGARTLLLIFPFFLLLCPYTDLSHTAS